MAKLPYLCILKSKGKTCIVKEPSHVKHPPLKKLFKIGLNFLQESGLQVDDTEINGTFREVIETFREAV